MNRLDGRTLGSLVMAGSGFDRKTGFDFAAQRSSRMFRKLRTALFEIEATRFGDFQSSRERVFDSIGLTILPFRYSGDSQMESGGHLEQC